MIFGEAKKRLREMCVLDFATINGRDVERTGASQWTVRGWDGPLCEHDAAVEVCRTEDNDAEKKPHLSPSQLDTLAMCGERWRRRYIDGVIIPPGTAMLRGTGVHGGIKENFSQKIESWNDLPVDAVVDASVAAFDGEWGRGVQLDADEATVGLQLVKGRTTDTVVELARCFHQTTAALYQPTRVEEGFRIVLPDLSHDLIGYLDFMAFDRGMEDGNLPDDIDRIVVDVKTSGKRRSKEDADRSIQLTAYAAAGCNMEGVNEMEVRLEVAVAKKKPEIQCLQSHRGQQDFSVLGRRVQQALKIIESGAFSPAPVGAWWCAPKWCGYWATCPYVNAERKGAAEL